MTRHRRLLFNNNRILSARQLTVTAEFDERRDTAMSVLSASPPVVERSIPVDLSVRRLPIVHRPSSTFIL